MWDDILERVFFDKKMEGAIQLSCIDVPEHAFLDAIPGCMNRISVTVTLQGADQCASVYLAVMVQGHLLDMDNS